MLGLRQQWAGLADIFRATLAAKTPETIRIPLRELPERARGDPTARGLALVTLGFRRLAGTVRDAGRYRQLLGFLGVFFLYMTTKLLEARKWT